MELLEMLRSHPSETPDIVQPTILITGASGFVGAAMVRHFHGQSWGVMASSRGIAPDALLQYASYARADIQQPMTKQAEEVVIHAAALASDSAPLAELRKVNLDGTRHVFEATRDSKIFVYISSSSVYDYRNEIHVENEPVDLSSLSYYGRTKREAENWLLKQDWSERTLVILRPRAVYGIGDRMLLPRMLHLVRKGRIVIPGDMRIQTSLTHVDNLCKAVAQCVDCFRNDPGGAHIFNVADQETYQMREAVQLLLFNVLGENLAFRSLSLPLIKVLSRAAEQLRITTPFSRLALASVSCDNVLDVNKIKNLIGFQATYVFSDAVKEIGAWARSVGIENIRMAKPDLPWMITTGNTLRGLQPA